MDKKVSDEVYEERVKTMEKIVSKLEQVEGVDKVVLDDYNPDTARTGQIVVYVDSDGGKMIYGEGQTYQLDVNLRSLSPRMRAVFKSSELFNFDVYEKPEKRYNVVDEPVGYDSDRYVIDVVP